MITAVTVAKTLKDYKLLNLWKAAATKYTDGFIIEESDPKLVGGSNQHGDGLNRVIRKVTTEYTIILDTDCILLAEPPTHKDLLAARKTAVTMHVCYLIGKTDFLKTQDFTALGGKVSYQPHEDVAHKLGLLNQDLQLVGSNEGILFGGEIQCDEICYKDVTLASHFGRGSNLTGKIVKGGRENINKQYRTWIEKMEKEIL